MGAPVLRALFYACRERHEPLGANQLEFASDWLVEKNLRVHRIDAWTDERWVEKVDAHCPAWILLVSRLRIVGEIGASDRREITVMNGDKRVLVFFQCRTDRLQFRGQSYSLLLGGLSPCQ